MSEDRDRVGGFHCEMQMKIAIVHEQNVKNMMYVNNGSEWTRRTRKIPKESEIDKRTTRESISMRHHKRAGETRRKSGKGYGKKD